MKMTDHSHHDNSKAGCTSRDKWWLGSALVMRLRTRQGRWCILFVVMASVGLWLGGFRAMEADGAEEPATRDEETKTGTVPGSEDLDELMGPEDARLFRLFDRIATAERKDPCSPELKGLSAELDEALGRTSRWGKDANELAAVDANSVIVADANAVSPDDANLVSLYEKMLGAQERDPCAWELELLSEQLDRALRERGEQIESDPDADLGRLPGQVGEAAAAAVEVTPEPAMPESRPNGVEVRRLPPGLTVVERLAGKDVVEVGPKVEKVRIDATAAEATGKMAEPNVPRKPPSPDDAVKITVKDNVLDINMLIETVGRELKFTFLYDTAKGISAKVKLQQFGEIRRRDLLPLLESVLGFHDLAMIREDPFIRIVKRADALKKTDMPIVFGDEVPDLESGDMVVTQIMQLHYVKSGVVNKLLSNFAQAVKVVDIPNTSLVIITDYAKRLPRLLELVRMIDQPGPPKRLEILQVEYVKANEVQGTIAKLMKALAAQKVDTGGAKSRERKARPSRAKRKGAKKKKPAGQALVGGAGAGAPVFHVDARTNRLFVIGTEEQIEQVVHLLSLLDVDTVAAIAPKLAIVEISNVEVKDIVGPLGKLYDAMVVEGEAGKSAPPAAKGKKARAAKGRRPRAGKTGATRVGKTGPFMLPLEAINVLIVVGSDEQIQMVEDLVGVLDVDTGAAIPPELAIIQISNVEVAELVGSLVSLYDAMVVEEDEVGKRTAAAAKGKKPAPATRRRPIRGRTGGTKVGKTGPFMLPLESTNVLIVVGRAEQIEMVEELIEVLDVVPNEYGGVPRLEMYQPRFIAVAEAQRILDSLGITRKERPSARERARGAQTGAARQPEGALPGTEEFVIRIAMQEDLNKMFVLATEMQHREIASILEQVDEEPNEVAGAIQIYPLNNRDPADVASMLVDLLGADTMGADNKRIPGMEDAPTIRALDDVHSVAVRGTPKQHREIAEIIKKLDIRLPQVLVEAILVQVSGDEGLDLGITLQNAWETGRTRSGRTRNISVSSPFGFAPMLTNNLVTGTGGVLAFFTDSQVFATLEALQDQGNAKVVSKPRILVNDNEVGTIVSTEKQPTTKTILTVGSDIPIITFDKYVEAGTTLRIEPHISEAGFLKLNLQLDVSSFGEQGIGNVPPETFVNSLQTVVTVPDGMTIILGGLSVQNNSLSVDKVPFLGDIPLLGALFRRVSRNDSRSVLYIFVRAHIVRSDGVNEDFRDLDALSAHYRRSLVVEEDKVKRQTIIPGFGPDKKAMNDPGALNDWYDPCEVAVGDYYFAEYGDNSN